MHAISAELEATAATLGIKPGRGWQERLEHESERLPGPQTQDCDAMRRWFNYMPAGIQTRARLLEQLHWLVARIDHRLWENLPEDFDEFDRDLAALRSLAEHVTQTAFADGTTCGTAAIMQQRPEPTKRP
jgi:hypothetical protein